MHTHDDYRRFHITRSRSCHGHSSSYINPRTQAVQSTVCGEATREVRNQRGLQYYTDLEQLRRLWRDPQTGLEFMQNLDAHETYAHVCLGCGESRSLHQQPPVFDTNAPATLGRRLEPFALFAERPFRAMCAPAQGN